MRYLLTCTKRTNFRSRCSRSTQTPRSEARTDLRAQCTLATPCMFGHLQRSPCPPPAASDRKDPGAPPQTGVSAWHFPASTTRTRSAAHTLARSGWRGTRRRRRSRRRPPPTSARVCKCHRVACLLHHPRALLCWIRSACYHHCRDDHEPGRTPRCHCAPGSRESGSCRTCVCEPAKHWARRRKSAQRGSRRTPAPPIPRCCPAGPGTHVSSGTRLSPFPDVTASFVPHGRPSHEP